MRRVIQNRDLEVTLQAFRGLKDLWRRLDSPKKSKIREIYADVFADNLANIYAQQDCIDLDIEDEHNYGDVDSIELAELKSALCKLAIGKSCDGHVLVVELLKFASDVFLILLLDQYNEILTRRVIDEEWLSIVFKMLPKHGDLHNPSNSWPIEILPTVHKVFAKIIVDRIHLLLESEQSDDSFGCRLGKRIEDMFAYLRI